MRATTPSPWRLVVLPVGLVLLLSACGSSDEGAEESETTVTSTTTTTTTVVSSGTSAPEPATGVVDAITKTAGIDYADDGVLDVFAPGAPGPWPVVIVVHGASQDNGLFAPISEAIATQGAVVYNISAAMGPPFLAAIEQVACAVRFARSTALIDALVGYEGPYDHALREYGPFDLTTLEQEDPEHWEAINTFTHIGGNPDLVVRLVHGRDNDVAWYDVAPEVSIELHDAMTEPGYDVGLTFVEGASHVDLLSTTEAYEVAVEQTFEVARG